MPLLPHLAAFESRDFRYIWGANALGGASTWTFLIASQWYVLSESDKSLLVGLFTFASMLPYLLVSPIGGILADRTERKKLTAITQAGITISIVISVLLSLFGVLNLWHLCILAFAAGCFRSTQESALVSLVTNVVPKKTLLNAITLNSATRHGSRVIGMGLLLMTRVPLGEGLDITQFLLASSLLGAISLILIIRVRKRSTGESLPETGLLRGMIDGVKFIYTKHEVGIFIILVALPRSYLAKYLFKRLICLSNLAWYTKISSCAASEKPSSRLSFLPIKFSNFASSPIFKVNLLFFELTLSKILISTKFPSRFLSFSDAYESKKIAIKININF